MNTDKLIAHGRARFAHSVAKRTLKEKYQGKLIFAYNGGMFKATPELITFLKFCESSRETIIADMNDNPVKVNVHAMTMLATNTYKDQMDAWLTEYEELNKNR